MRGINHRSPVQEDSGENDGILDTTLLRLDADGVSSPILGELGLEFSVFSHI